MVQDSFNLRNNLALSGGLDLNTARGAVLDAILLLDTVSIDHCLPKLGCLQAEVRG